LVKFETLNLGLSFSNFSSHNRRQVQVAGRGPFGLDVGIHALHLLCAQLNGGGRLFGRDAVVLGIQAQVHLFVRQQEKEFVLALFQRIGVRGRLAFYDFLRNPQKFRQLVNLALVQVRDGFYRPIRPPA